MPSAQNRRNFIKNATALGGLLALQPFLNEGFSNELLAHVNKSPLNLAKDENFWNWVRNEFDVSKRMINLNNGGVSPCPRSVQNAMFENFKMSNEAPSYYMWRVLDKNRENLRKKLADIAGTEPNEIAINRNSTEGLNSIIFGLNLQKGDEIIVTKQDYPNMLNAWQQREKRDGIVLKKLDLKLPEDDDAIIVKLFTEAFTSKTKIVHITHIINWTGQILPVKKIANEAHKRGIEVIVDAAHSFAHLDFKIPDLDADYLATSLHKWLYAPFGSGMLYIKKEKIKNVWALLSNNEPDGTDIRKFESLGTRSFASEMAINNAADFYSVLGAARKQERLIYLKQYWTNGVKDLSNIQLNTTLESTKSCAIANVKLRNMTAAQLDNLLWSKYQIHTVNIQWPGIDGVRITPNVYTNTKDLDKLIDALTTLNKM
jgi:selenocysteine lyase/cysteine desulfurase